MACGLSIGIQDGLYHDAHTAIRPWVLLMQCYFIFLALVDVSFFGKYLFWMCGFVCVLRVMIGESPGL